MVWAPQAVAYTAFVSIELFPKKAENKCYELSICAVLPLKHCVMFDFCFFDLIVFSVRLCV